MKPHFARSTNTLSSGVPPHEKVEPPAESPVSPPAGHEDIARLREENKKLRWLFDLLPQNIYLKDRRSRFQLANKAMLNMLRQEDFDGVSGKTDRDFFPADLAEKFLQDERQVLEEGRAILNQVEPCAISKTRKPAWLMTTKVPVRDDSGEVIGLVGIGSDITELRKQEAMLHLQAVALDAAANSIVITNRNGSILWVNKAFTKRSGYTMEEMIGRSPAIFRPENHSPEFRKKLWESLMAGQVWSGEVPYRNRAGHTSPEHITITPIFAENGRLTNLVAIMQDLSRQRKLEVELKGTNAAIENADDGIILSDLEGKISYANPAFLRLFKMDAATAFASSLPGILSKCKISHTGVVPTAHSVLSHGWEEQLDYTDEGGRSLKFRVRVSRIRDDEGARLGYACHFFHSTSKARQRDEQQRLEIRLRQAEKLESIGQLAAGIAHEINTPTQFVGDNLYFLGDSIQELMEVVEAAQESLSEAPGPALEAKQKIVASLEKIDLQYLKEELPVCLEQSKEGVSRITEIVQAMKEFSHPGSKVRQLMDLNDALQKAATVARNEWKYHCKIGFDLDPNMEPLHCLGGEINQVFLNILVNAAHAVRDVVESGERESGFIHVTTQQFEESVEIRIADNGTGVPDEIKDRIFDPFFTTKEVGKGTGQGLAIAYDVVVHKHRGELYVESENGKGSIFTIRLPRHLKDAE